LVRSSEEVGTTSSPNSMASCSKQEINPLAFLVEEAADQPSCSVLPNAGPKPLRPSLRGHLSPSPESATPKFKFLLGFSGARESLYMGPHEKSFARAKSAQADWMYWRIASASRSI
jgi:hypothetical protein